MNDIVQLKIQLEDIKPEIWRQILVPVSYSLRELHVVIQGAMGWQDSHLHMFEIAGTRYEIPEWGCASEPGVRDELHFKLEDFISAGATFSYVYDFGDNWRHAVIVEDEREAQHWDAAPRCMAGARACPPEDCGGRYRYLEFLEALSDPTHPDHMDMTEWAPGFESEAFNVAQANSLIRAICALYQERGWGFDR